VRGTLWGIINFISCSFYWLFYLLLLNFFYFFFYRKSLLKRCNFKGKLTVFYPTIVAFSACACVWGIEKIFFYLWISLKKKVFQRVVLVKAGNWLTCGWCCVDRCFWITILLFCDKFTQNRRLIYTWWVLLWKNLVFYMRILRSV